MTSALAVLLYFGGVAAAAAAVALTGRKIPPGFLAVFALLPFALFLPDIVLDKTLLPTDQTYLFRATTPAPRNPWLNDLATQNLPWAEKVRITWRAGGLPLRDRWNGCGSSLAGNGLARAFSPLTLLAVVLPLHRAFGLGAAWKLFAALAGMWLWLRELRSSNEASLFGALSFALSFSIIPWIFFPIGAAIAAWPWVLFAVERLRDPERPGRAIAFLVMVLTVWPLLGHIESVVSGACLLAVLLLARWASGGLPAAPRLAATTVLAGAAAAGLTAFTLLPQAYAILASNRKILANVSFYASQLGLAPHGLLWMRWRAIFFPSAFGDGMGRPMLPNTAAFPEMALGYIGIAGWAMALLVLRPGSRRAAISSALVTVILLAVCLSYGAWPFAEIAARLPGLGLMFPLRFLSWVALAGSALAALELDRWLRDWESTPRRGVVFAVLAAGALAVLTLDTQRRYVLAGGPRVGSSEPVSALGLTLACLAAFVIAVSLALLQSPAARRALPCVLLSVAAAELLLQGARFYRIGPAAAVFPGSPLALFLRSRPAPFRMVGRGFDFFPARSVFVGAEDVRTHDPLERRDYVEFLDATCGYPPADYFKHVVNLEAPALDFLNVRYLVSVAGGTAPGRKWRAVYGDFDGTVFENGGALPRIFAPQVVVGVPGTPPRGPVGNANALFRDALLQLKEVQDFQAKAFVLGEPAGLRANGRVEITDYVESGRRATFHSRAADSVVLVTSLVQDGGWDARDEARVALPTTLANGPFLALRVPSGDHRVFLRYVPPGWRAGYALSLLTATALLATAIGRRRFQRKRGSPLA